MSEGRGGDGLKPATISAARRGAETGTWSEDKIIRASAWFARHASDRKPGWDDPGKETPGFVAWLLWGDNGNGKGRAFMDKEADRVRKDEEDAARKGTVPVLQNINRYASMCSMSEPTLLPLVEAASAQVVPDQIITDPAVLVERGLDPELFIAIVPAELGKAGKVNRNRRIYKPEEFVPQHDMLAARLKEQFVDAELGHPDWMNGPGFEIPARLISVECYKEQSGVTCSRGEYAILNTTAGKDLLVLLRAGFRAGTSSRGRGMVEEHVLDDASPYTEMNPGMEGQTVGLVSEFRLDKTPYDIVRDPSADTFMANMDPRLKESLSTEILRFFGLEEPDMAVKPEPQSGITQEQMDAAVSEALADPKIVKALKVLETLDPTGKETAEVVLARVAALESTNLELSKRNEGFANRLTEAEAKAATHEVDLKAVKEALAASAAEKAALEAAKALAEAINMAVKASTHPKVLRQHLESMFGDNLVAGVPENVVKLAERFEKALTEAAQVVSPEVPVVPADVVADPAADTVPDVVENVGYIPVSELNSALKTLGRRA